MNMEFKRITGEELKSKVNILDYLGELCDNELYVGTAIFVDGDYETDGDFTNDTLAQWDPNQEADFLLINGNLSVNGNFNPGEETFPNIVILGNLTADNLQNGEELVAVNGDLTVKNMIYGSYNHGGMIVNGTTTATYVINYDHQMIIPNLHAELAVNAYRDDVNPRYDQVSYNMLKTELLEKVKAEYLSDYGGVDMDKLVLDLRNEITVFK